MKFDVKGFRDFVLRGNVVDLAVAVVLGLAFNALITTVVNAIIDPIITAIIGKPSFGNLTFTIHHSVFFPGNVIGALINFVAIAGVVYFLVVQPVGALLARFNPPIPDLPAPTKECPECLSSIPAAAVRCAFCTVEQ